MPSRGRPSQPASSLPREEAPPAWEGGPDLGVGGGSIPGAALEVVATIIEPTIEAEEDEGPLGPGTTTAAPPQPRPVEWVMVTSYVLLLCPSPVSSPVVVAGVAICAVPDRISLPLDPAYQRQSLPISADNLRAISGRQSRQ